MHIIEIVWKAAMTAAAWFRRTFYFMERRIRDRRNPPVCGRAYPPLCRRSEERRKLCLPPPYSGASLPSSTGI